MDIKNVISLQGHREPEDAPVNEDKARTDAKVSK